MSHSTMFSPIGLNSFSPADSESFPTSNKSYDMDRTGAAGIEQVVQSRIRELYGSDFQRMDDLVVKTRRPNGNNTASGIAFIFKELCGENLNLELFVHDVMKKKFQHEIFKSKEEKLQQTELEVFVKCTIVLYMSCLPKYSVFNFKDIAQLLMNYPMFSPEFVASNEKYNGEVDLWPDVTKKNRNKRRLDGQLFDEITQHQLNVELDRLLRFRNYIKIALQVIPAEGNKDILLKIAAKLEGAGENYITGGDPRPATRRRIIIYETEGKIRAKKKSIINLNGAAASMLTNMKNNNMGSSDNLAAMMTTMPMAPPAIPLPSAKVPRITDMRTGTGVPLLMSNSNRLLAGFQHASATKYIDGPLTSSRSAAFATGFPLSKEPVPCAALASQLPTVSAAPSILYSKIECPAAPAMAKDIIVPEPRDLACMTPYYQTYLNNFYSAAYWDKMHNMVMNSITAASNYRTSSLGGGSGLSYGNSAAPSSHFHPNA